MLLAATGLDGRLHDAIAGNGATACLEPLETDHRKPTPPMKLRIKGDSIRLRLTRTEVRQLAQAGRVEDEVRVGPGAALRYGLRAADGDRLSANFEGDALTVLVPRDWTSAWADGDDVGFDGTQDAGDGRTLALLVEKDFECLHKRPDEADAFPHPLADAQ